MPQETVLSKSQLDRLGSRLRNSSEPSDDDLTLLNDYREQFVPLSRSVVETLRTLSEYPIESRHKSIPSIVAKLRRRQPARLSSIQDMAGARVIVPDIEQQDIVWRAIAGSFAGIVSDDKRTAPSFGYRAIHLIIGDPLPFEIQLRTAIQHAWAELSERLADRYGFELKYGGGPGDVRSALLEYSQFGAVVEQFLADARTGQSMHDTTVTLDRIMKRLPNILETLRIE